MPRRTLTGRFTSCCCKKMPGLELTPEVYGKPVVVSPGYSIQVLTKGGQRVKGPLEEFLGEFEDTGTNPADVYYDSYATGAQVYYRAPFPGCLPGECKKTARQTPIYEVSSVDWERFAVSSETDIDFIEILPEEIGGVEYFTEVNVAKDYRGRSRTYRVWTFREATSSGERRFLRDYPGTLEGIPVFQYSRNMVLNVEASTFATGLLKGVDTAKGL